MSDVVVDDVVEKDVDQEKAEVYTKEKVAELVKTSVEEATGRLNKEFQKKFATIKKEKETVIESKSEYEKETREIVANMQRESKVSRLLAQSIKAYTNAGADIPDDEVILDMIRVDSDDPLRVVNAMIERESQIKEKTFAEAKEKEAKTKGRKITSTDLTTVDKMSYADMQALPNDEFNKIPLAVVKKAMEEALKQE
jgi:competence CoiA-like predicted nuclease